MLRTSVALVFLLALSARIGAQQPSTLSPGEKLGRKLFQTRCAMCHVGQDPATELAKETAPRQTTLGPLLSKAQTVNESGLRDKIKNGGAKMPGYKYALTDEQIDLVVAFMKTIERPMTKLALTIPGE